MPRGTFSLIWNYFKKENKDDDQAYCKPCFEKNPEKKLFLSSVKGSSSTLHGHLRSAHRKLYDEMKNKVNFNSSTEKAQEDTVHFLPPITSNIRSPGRSKSHAQNSKKRLVDVNRPRVPLTAYFQYVADRRAELGPEFSSKFDGNKNAMAAMGVEWQALSVETRSAYRKKADEMRVEYLKELEEYKKTDSYKEFQKKLTSYKAQDDTLTPPAPKSENPNEPDPNLTRAFGDIPIFTPEFLDHNRAREAELRRLRSEMSKLEEEESILHDSVERLRSACQQSDAELNEHKLYQAKLEKHSQAYSMCLIGIFGNLPLPDYPDGLNDKNFDQYLNQLCKIVNDDTMDTDLVNKIKERMNRVKLPNVEL